VGIILGIDTSSSKEVGASKRMVHTRKLITSVTNRFESGPYYTWMSCHHGGNGPDSPRGINYTKAVHWRYLLISAFPGDYTARGRPLRASYHSLTRPPEYLKKNQVRDPRESVLEGLSGPCNPPLRFLTNSSALRLGYTLLSSTK